MHARVDRLDLDRPIGLPEVGERDDAQHERRGEQQEAGPERG